MLSFIKSHFRQGSRAFVCAIAVLVAACHGTPNTSGYGTAWVTVTDEPGDYTSYIVTIDSILLTREDGTQYEALGTPEIVDLASLSNIAEMWGASAVPEGIYLSAVITMDYTSAQITVNRDGSPVLATVLDAVTGAAPTTYAVTVLFDRAHLPNFTPTYASTSAQRLALDFDLAASGTVVVPATGTPTVFVRPFVTVGILASDNKLIRIRGPLINSSTDVQTYTVYVRPFYDEANNIGSVSLFSNPNTHYTINGNTYIGSAGLDQLSGLSAGTTMTAGYVQLQTDYNPINQAYAGRFNLVYVVGGSTLEDIYTEGISGDVTHRTGNTLTLHGSTVFLNTADTFSYLTVDAHVLLGPGTIVTADNNTTLSGLDYNSIAVGQHITVRGTYSLAADASTIINATGTSSANTGSVRLQSTDVYGSLVSAASGSLVMNVQTIGAWPIADYDFAGAAANPVPTAFSVNTTSNAGTLALPAGTAAGDPVWAYGFFAPFGTAAPDFNAVAVNDESSVQLAGTQAGGGVPVPGPAGPGVQGCGVGSQVCEPAVFRVIWTGTDKLGTATPFETFGDGAFTIDRANAKYFSGEIQIGQERIELTSLAVNPTVVATTAVDPNPTTVGPRYAVGNPVAATSTSTVTSTESLAVYSNFPAFITQIKATMTTTNPALELAARGWYDRAANMFYATSIDFVL